MRMTTRTDLALRALMFCAANPGKILRRQDLTRACGGSENHMAQVIHLLGRAGFLKTRRGRSGGLSLGHEPEAISVGAVFRQFKAVIPFTECAAGSEPPCPLKGLCRLQCLFDEALEAFYKRLDQTNLAELVAGNTGLDRVLQVA